MFPESFKKIWMFDIGLENQGLHHLIWLPSCSENICRICNILSRVRCVIGIHFCACTFTTCNQISWYVILFWKSYPLAFLLLITQQWNWTYKPLLKVKSNHHPIVPCLLPCPFSRFVEITGYGQHDIEQ